MRRRPGQPSRDSVEGVEQGVELGEHPLERVGVGVRQLQVGTGQAEPARGEVGAEFFGEPRRLGFELLGRDERIGPGTLHVKRRRFDERAAGFGALAQRLVETQQNRLDAFRRTEAALQGGARQTIKIADALEAEALQQQHRIGR